MCAIGDIDAVPPLRCRRVHDESVGVDQADLYAELIRSALALLPRRDVEMVWVRRVGGTHRQQHLVNADHDPVRVVAEGAGERARIMGSLPFGGGVFVPQRYEDGAPDQQDEARHGRAFGKQGQRETSDPARRFVRSRGG